MDQDFLNNDIYKHLKDKGNSKLVSIIETTYDNCEYILGQIPKEFSNYTIHDIHHAIRVINYMTEFVKPNINEYSDLHLALILLVGLLHDIGMFVSDEEKKEILDTIGLEKNDNQQEEFQNYIRERHSKRVRKIIDNYIIDKESNSKFSSVFRLDSYNFTDDIAIISQSHTESLEWIKENLRTSKSLTNYLYNPQHIALLLKLGDNLDIDARRAPYSLLKLLKIKGYSETEWEKHSPITNYNKIKYLDNHRFHLWFDGVCENPFIYRKTMEHILWLQDICSGISSIASLYDHPFRFCFDDEIEIKIKTIGFENTNLQFSIDYSSILKLLMGEQLYGDKRAGLRELLQNSIDAIMVMREKLSNNITSNYKPTIWIELNKDKHTFSIYDNGIGMNEYVLKNYFFNIGKSFYNSDDYKNQNLNYSAIGQFGIGFLACFMLSSSVLLESKTIDQDPIAFEFESMSPFITKLSNSACIFEEGHGTRIHLSYDEIFPDVFSEEDELVSYLYLLLITDNYCIKIIKSNNDIIEFSDIKAAIEFGQKCIHTDNFDIAYTLYKPASMFWYDFRQISNDQLFIYCDEKDLDIPGIKPMVVDLGGVCDAIHQLFVRSNGIIDDNYNLQLDTVNCQDTSICTFLSAFIRKNDTEEKLFQRINQFVLARSHIDDTFSGVYCSYFDLQQKNQGMERFVLLNLPYQFESNGMSVNLSEVYKLMPEYMSNIIMDHYKNVRYVLSTNSGLCLPFYKAMKIDVDGVYMHGIHIGNENIEFPHVPFNFAFENCIINVKSNKYKLNVSRNDFEHNSRIQLCLDIAKEIYYDMLRDEQFTDEEKQLLSMAINKFCK